jgi:putative SOS response-associated peptidase YedK
MCFEFAQTFSAPAAAAHFDIAGVPELTPRPHLFPKQPVAVVGLKADGRTRGMTFLSWGLVPGWANDLPPQSKRPHNAKAETVHHLPTFRDSFRSKRCLVPADSFFEGPKAKRFRIGMKGGGVFAFAGLWDVWEGDGARLGTCCFLTTTPNELVQPIHARMPVILPPAAYAAWLDPGTPVPELKALLRPYPAGEMEATAVV